MTIEYDQLDFDNRDASGYPAILHRKDTLVSDELPSFIEEFIGTQAVLIPSVRITDDNGCQKRLKLTMY